MSKKRAQATSRFPNYLKYDKAVYFHGGWGLAAGESLQGPGYEIRPDAVILQRGTDAPHPHRASHLPLLVHGALYHAIASGRLRRSWRWRADFTLMQLMKLQGCNLPHRTIIWLAVVLFGRRMLRRQREAMLATGSVLRMQ